jgi:catechol 2,3-dioxygenase-like lactoylglutathione lyase family enzyme
MKTHLSLPTGSIDESVAFYRSLLGASPHKHHHDYALFITEQPPLELALDLQQTRSAGHEVNAHFGIAVDSAAAVDEAIDRLRSAGIGITVERDQTCCYAKQDKVWSSDPDGRRWEIYYVSEESAQRDGDGSTCCTSDSCETFATCCGTHP